MNKTYYTWKDLESAAEHIALGMYRDMWRPDYIVGITQNGMCLATVLSNKISVPLASLQVDLGTTDLGNETNCWLSEWAFGYNYPEETGISGARWDLTLRRNILVVDSFTKNGEVIKWIKEDWQGSCLPQEINAWNSIWHKSVRFATMVDNLNSDVNADYSWKEIDYDQQNQPVFPWVGKQ